MLLARTSLLFDLIQALVGRAAMPYVMEEELSECASLFYDSRESIEQRLWSFLRANREPSGSRSATT